MIVKLSDARLAELEARWKPVGNVVVSGAEFVALVEEVRSARANSIGCALLVGRAHNTSNVMAKFARGDLSMSPDDLREVSDLLRELGDFIDAR